MECGCDAEASFAWIKTFDLLQEIDKKPKRRASQREADISDISRHRRQVVLVSSSCVQASHALQVFRQCMEERCNVVHKPIVAQLYASEVFSSPQLVDIKWTSRVRGVSMQVHSLQALSLGDRSLPFFISLDGLTGA